MSNEIDLTDCVDILSTSTNPVRVSETTSMPRPSLPNMLAPRRSPYVLHQREHQDAPRALQSTVLPSMVLPPMAHPRTEPTRSTKQPPTAVTAQQVPRTLPVAAGVVLAILAGSTAGLVYLSIDGSVSPATQRTVIPPVSVTTSVTIPAVTVTARVPEWHYVTITPKRRVLPPSSSAAQSSPTSPMTTPAQTTEAAQSTDVRQTVSTPPTTSSAS